jgi:hypothetical protein
MDAGSWDPHMKRFVEVLIDRARGRPVLQFNRIDFRLPWFRHHFPRAKIIHLYRHPREQWCSSLVDPAACPPSASMADFGRHDHFYLRHWARDLNDHFPFLDEASIGHPYRLFYCMWKLSYLFGRCYSQHSLAYEDLVANPETSITGLLRAAGIHGVNADELRQLIVRPQQEKWKQYAEPDWFSAHESACEAMICDYFASWLPAKPVHASDGNSTRSPLDAGHSEDGCVQLVSPAPAYCTISVALPTSLTCASAADDRPAIA